MDLMNTLRFLLFCSSVLSGSRGCHCSRDTNHRNQAVKVNKTLVFETKPLNRKQVLLNVHRDSRIRTSIDKHVYQDSYCFKCIDCMDRAVAAIRQNKRRDRQTHQKTSPYTKKYYIKQHNDIDRYKRSAFNVAKKEIEQGRAFLATVIKYTKNKKVYAIEVKTATNNENEPGDTCNYYNIKKTLSCEGEHRMLRSKRTNKNSKKVKKYSATTTESLRTSIKNDYKKRRDVESSQAPESYMLSMEDFY